MKLSSSKYIRYISEKNYSAKEENGAGGFDFLTPK